MDLTLHFSGILRLGALIFADCARQFFPWGLSKVDRVRDILLL